MNLSGRLTKPPEINLSFRSASIEDVLFSRSERSDVSMLSGSAAVRNNAHKLAAIADEHDICLSCPRCSEGGPSINPFLAQSRERKRLLFGRRKWHKVSSVRNVWGEGDDEGADAHLSGADVTHSRLVNTTIQDGELIPASSNGHSFLSRSHHARKTTMLPGWAIRSRTDKHGMRARPF